MKHERRTIAGNTQPTISARNANTQVQLSPLDESANAALAGGMLAVQRALPPEVVRANPAVIAGRV
jgi:hypothetical protein